MLFDLLRRGLYFEKDSSGGSEKTDDSAGDDAEKDKDKSAEDQKTGDDKSKAKKEDKLFSQAELDQIVKDRLERERKKAEAEAEKARKKAEADALENNQEWQKLAEQRQAEIDDLTKQKTELEAFKASSEKYKAALDAQLAKAKEKLPKHILPLIEKMDPVEAMEYITTNSEALGVKPETYGETPDGKEKTLSDDDKKKAEQASTIVIQRSF